MTRRWKGKKEAERKRKEDGERQKFRERKERRDGE